MSTSVVVVVGLKKKCVCTFGNTCVFYILLLKIYPQKEDINVEFDTEKNGAECCRSVRCTSYRMAVLLLLRNGSALGT